MENRLFLRPKQGLKVQKCFSDFGRIEIVKEDGEWLPNTLYYRRMVKRGELIRTIPPKKQGAKKK